MQIKVTDQDGHLFIDRDASTFAVLLAFLRDGPTIPLPSDEYFLARIAHEVSLAEVAISLSLSFPLSISLYFFLSLTLL